MALAACQNQVILCFAAYVEKSNQNVFLVPMQVETYVIRAQILKRNTNSESKIAILKKQC